MSHAWIVHVSLFLLSNLGNQTADLLFVETRKSLSSSLLFTQRNHPLNDEIKLESCPIKSGLASELFRISSIRILKNPKVEET